MTIWWVLVLSWVWGAFMDRLVDHFSNSATMLLASWGVGTMSTKSLASVQPVLCILNWAPSPCNFALIVLTTLFAGGWAWMGGFSSISTITLLG